MLRALDREQLLADFAREGYVRVGRLCDEATLQGLRQRIDDIMLGRITYPGLFFQKDSPTGSYDDLVFGAGWQGPGLDYRKIEKLELDENFRNWIANPAFAELAHALIGSVAISLYRAVLFAKNADSGGTALPWHQDGGVFWGVDPSPTLQIWTALDDIPVEAGCLEVVPRTHTSGLATPQGGTIPDRCIAEAEAEARIVKLPAAAGEVVLIHNHLWHRSGRNLSGRPRRALSVCYMPSTTRCLRRRGAPRQFFQVWP